MDKRPFIIGITGGSGSGKTRFLNGLLSKFSKEEVCLISQDNYYKPRDMQPVDIKGVKNFDLPESIDFEEYKKDILSLKNGEAVTRKEYTFNNPSANSKTITLTPAPVIVVEGIFVLYYRPIAQMLDMKLYIDAKDYIKLIRRIVRDDKERGYDLDDVLYRYEHHVMPTYEKHIKPFKSEADIIIPNHKSFNSALDVIVTYVRSKMV
ncbi:MAG: uridine kinase [Cyclobacteriaceae bacterium]|nr:uridine kinase [Cyclobacteriaceae bacterium]